MSESQECTCQWVASLVEMEEPEYDDVLDRANKVYQTRGIEIYRDIRHILNSGCKVHAYLLRMGGEQAVPRAGDVMALGMERRFELAGRLGNKLLKFKLPQWVRRDQLVQVSLDYILQEHYRKGVVDLTGETSVILKADESGE